MLEILLSDGSQCTPIKCNTNDILEHIHVQANICAKSAKFLIDPLKIRSFTYTFEEKRNTEETASATVDLYKMFNTNSDKKW